jgi:hypothetical protein
MAFGAPLRGFVLAADMTTGRRFHLRSSAPQRPWTARFRFHWSMPEGRLLNVLLVCRHVADAGIETAIGCHTFRATGITDYLTNGGRIEVAQHMAGHGNAKDHRALRPA